MKVNIGPYKDNRKISIKIDPYDVWNLDHTLAMIIHPALLQLNKGCSSPRVSDDDVPEELKSTSASPKENEWDLDENYHKRWEYVLGEMIFAFSEIASGDWEKQYHLNGFDMGGYLDNCKRIENGTRLFGVY